MCLCILPASSTQGSLTDLIQQQGELNHFQSQRIHGGQHEAAALTLSMLIKSCDLMSQMLSPGKAVMDTYELRLVINVCYAKSDMWSRHGTRYSVTRSLQPLVSAG